MLKCFRQASAKLLSVLEHFYHTDSVFRDPIPAFLANSKTPTDIVGQCIGMRNTGISQKRLWVAKTVLETVHPSLVKPTFEITAGSKIVTFLGS